MYKLEYAKIQFGMNDDRASEHEIGFPYLFVCLRNSSTMAHLPRSPTDAYPTETSDLQAETEEALAEHVPGGASASGSTLQKNAHLQFLIRNLVQGFPAKYISQDASQPWLMFWTVQSFSILQVSLDPTNKQKIIDTVMAWQHPDGGFGGGPGQSPHLLPTYAAVSALAIVGRPGPKGGWDQIDR